MSSIFKQKMPVKFTKAQNKILRSLILHTFLYFNYFFVLYL